MFVTKTKSLIMKLQPLSPMIGFQCSPSVQPVFGRGPTIFSSNGHVPVVTSASSNGFHSRPPITPPNILDYFPGLGGDGLRVSWAHAVNSRSKLNSALMGMFLFDINLCCFTSSSPSPRFSDIVCQGFALLFCRRQNDSTSRGSNKEVKETHKLS